MISPEIDFLPEDLYGFLGHKIGIKSNSHEILSCLRLMYGRFYLGCDDVPSSQQKKWGNASRFGIRVIDNLASSNELFLNDSFCLYRLSKNDSYYNVTYKNLHTLTCDSVRVSHPLTFVEGAMLRSVSLLASDYHLIHAGAVSWENEGMIFPASTRMGKTTLVLKLVSQGFGFLSDEIACLNPELDIIEPFPRKVNIRRGSRQLLRLPLNTIAGLTVPQEWGQTLDIEDIAPGSLSDPCAPRYILFLRGFGEKARLEYISSPEALFELFKFSISPIADPAFLLFKFAPLFDKVQCFNLVMGDLDETAELVMGLADWGKRHYG